MNVILMGTKKQKQNAIEQERLGIIYISKCSLDVDAKSFSYSYAIMKVVSLFP